MKIAKKLLFIGAGFFLLLCSLALLFFFAGGRAPREDVAWGVNFSEAHAEKLGLNASEAYRAILDDLGARRIKIAVPWDRTEPHAQEYDFVSLDWQVEEAERRGAKLILAVGMKTPRWPECHIPAWVARLPKEDQQERLQLYLGALIGRFRDSPAIVAWQVENEPFLPFGECPWRDEKFLAREIAVVKRIDPTRPVIVSTSGEFSLFLKAARFGDIVGTTLYRKVWFKEAGRYLTYPFPPVFYERRAWLVRKFFGKEVINVELQAEPWGPVLYYDLPLEEQMKTMSPERFRGNVGFARRTGIGEAYFWGAEWWYWMKETNGDPSFWDEAKKLFAEPPIIER